MNNYDRRWNNAVAMAHTIQYYLERNYIVLDSEDNIVKNITIDEKMIYMREGNVLRILFEKDKSLDHGMHTPIAEFNAQFNAWTVCRKILSPFKDMLC